jgi:hypothetical protein
MFPLFLSNYLRDFAFAFGFAFTVALTLTFGFGKLFFSFITA